MYEKGSELPIATSSTNPGVPGAAHHCGSDCAERSVSGSAAWAGEDDTSTSTAYHARRRMGGLSWGACVRTGCGEDRERSEEHTSELQSHSFISYAVFCLKKK